MPPGKAFIRKKAKAKARGKKARGEGTRKEIVNSLKETCFFDEQLFNHSELQ